MPRGKFATEHLAALSTEEAASSDQNDSKNEAKLTLVEPKPEQDSTASEATTPSAEASAVEEVSKEEVNTPSESSGIVFTLLLVTLFILISAGLVILFGDNQSANNTQQATTAQKIESAAASLPTQVKQKSIPTIPAPAAPEVQAQHIKVPPAPEPQPAVSSESAERELLAILNKN